MTEATPQAVEQPKTPVVVDSDPDAARYAELAKELEAEGGEDPAEEPSPKREQPREKGKFAKADDGKKAEEVVEPEKAAEGEQEKAKQPDDAEKRNLQAALRESREEARRANARLEEFNKAIADLRERKQTKDAPAVPDINENPVAYFQHQIAELQAKIEEAQTGTRKTAEQIEQDRNERNFWNSVIQSEQEFRSKEPDYDDACQHLEAGRVAELKAMYPDDNPNAQALAERYGLPSVEALREAVLNQDRRNVSIQAMQLGISPAQMYYDLAKQRGYQKAEAKPANGAADPKKLEAAKQVIETARNGQKAAKSIGGGEGGKSDNPLAITDLIDLYDEDPDEADKVFEQMRKQGLLG